MTERRGFSVWIAAAVLPVLAANGARAQDQTPASPGATDTTISQVFQDASSKACDAKNGSSPNVDGYDPAFCMKRTTTNGKCADIGGANTTLAGQAGNTCYYCQQDPFPASYTVFLVAMDVSEAAYKQGFSCSAVLSDAACFLACYGTGKFAPPPGTAGTSGGTIASSGAEPGSGSTPSTAAPTQKLQGYITNATDACYPAGPKNYNACDYPNVVKPAGCVCSPAPQPAKPAVQPTKTPATPTVRTVPDWSDTLTADAQTLLQNAGRISKAMTDAMDVTKHNNVGIGVGLMSSFGAVGKMIGVVAQQYKLLAAAKAIAAADQTPILAIASEATAESGTLASQAEEAAAQLGKTGGSPVGKTMGSASGGTAGYMEGATDLAAATTLPAQGSAPVCGVLSCARIAQLLQANVSTLRVVDAIRAGPAGMTAQQIAAGLQKIGINAQMATGMTNMMNQVRAGTPVIVGVKVVGGSDSPLHALVVEGLETQGGVSGLRIYDPLGWTYWQPIKAFQSYFDDVFVHPL